MQTDQKSLIEALGIGGLESGKQAEVLAMANNRLEEVLLDTVVDNFSEEQVADFKSVLEEDKNLEDKIAAITANVPLLADRIKFAIQKEILTLRAVLSTKS